mgnify:CR=1 FL=1
MEYLRLTLTWDVLKLEGVLADILSEVRLTLTWDVLKYRTWRSYTCRIWININMRCIEIAIAELQSPAVAGLTLTWDVLKSEAVKGAKHLPSD